MILSHPHTGRSSFVHGPSLIKLSSIQVISLLPKSYPGHSILTEDIGEIVKNNCDVCFGKKQFIVHGRATKSELRGCSDI